MSGITITGAPAGWPDAFIGHPIRYRWYDGVPWRYGLAQPYHTGDPVGEVLRVSGYDDFGQLYESEALRFTSYEGVWWAECRVEIAEVPA